MLAPFLEPEEPASQLHPLGSGLLSFQVWVLLLLLCAVFGHAMLSVSQNLIMTFCSVLLLGETVYVFSVSCRPDLKIRPAFKICTRWAQNLYVLESSQGIVDFGYFPWKRICLVRWWKRQCLLNDIPSQSAFMKAVATSNSLPAPSIC